MSSSLPTRLLTWARHHYPELVAAFAPLIIYVHMIFAGQVMYWGLPALQFVPWRVLTNNAFRQGHLPLWTPLLGMGAPILANHQSAVLYPPNWLALILPPEIVVSVLAVLHLSFAGLGMVRLARRSGINDFGAAIMGLSFGLSGYLTARLWFVTINNAAAWLPWIILAATPSDSPQSGRVVLKNYLLLSLLIALQLVSGHAQTTFYTLLLAGVWVVWRTLFSTSSPRPRYQSLIINLASLGLACLFALALTAIQIIPTAELLSLSPRADAAEYEFAMQYSLWPWRLITFIIPNLFGNPADGNYWGYGSYWEDHAYIGLLPLVFALFSLKLLFQRKSSEATPNAFRSLAIFGAITILISILLSLGQNTPIFPFLYDYIPGFDKFQAPARMLIGYTFAVSLLAGIGAHLWQASDSKRYWSRLGIAGSIGTLVLAAVGWYMLRTSYIVTFGSSLVYTAIVAMFTGILLLNQPRTPYRWHWLAIGLVIIDLGLAGVRLTPTVDRNFYQFDASTQSNGRLFQYAQDEYDVRFEEFFRFTSFYPINTQALHDSHLANLTVLSNEPTVNNFDPLRTARYVNYIKAMESSSQLQDLANVSLVVKRNGAVTPQPFAGTDWRVVSDAYMVASESDALSAITDPTFNPDTTVILEAVPESTLPAFVLAPADITILVTASSATTGTEAEQYMVFSQSYYPGWRAYVDNVPQPIYIADYAFMAVAVPAGLAHTITLEYAPASVTMGLIISTLATITFIILAATLRVRK